MTKKSRYINPVETIDTRCPKVELTEPVEPDKFDRHMRKARRDDIASRRQTFITQSKTDSQRDREHDGICTSIY